jgi:hypothetical protein
VTKKQAAELQAKWKLRGSPLCLHLGSPNSRETNCRGPFECVYQEKILRLKIIASLGNHILQAIICTLINAAFCCNCNVQRHRKAPRGTALSSKNTVLFIVPAKASLRE